MVPKICAASASAITTVNEEELKQNIYPNKTCLIFMRDKSSFIPNYLRYLRGINLLQFPGTWTFWKRHSPGQDMWWRLGPSHCSWCCLHWARPSWSRSSCSTADAAPRSYSRLLGQHKHTNISIADLLRFGLIILTLLVGCLLLGYEQQGLVVYG